MDKNYNKQQKNFGNQPQNPYTGSGSGNSGNNRETPFRNPGNQGAQGGQSGQTGKSYKETGLGQEKKSGQQPGPQTGAQTGQRGQKESRENLRPHGFPSGQSKEKNKRNAQQDWEGAGAEQEENLRGRNHGEKLPPAGLGSEFDEQQDEDISGQKRSRKYGHEEEDEDLGNRI